MSRALRSGAALAFVAVLSSARVSSAFERALSTDGAYLRWDQVGSIRLALDPGGPEGLELVGAARRAAETWSRCLPEGPRIEAGSALAPVSLRWVERDWPFGASLVAHTEVHSDGPTGRIHQVEISLDASRTWSTAPLPALEALDLESVLLHELGHALGLGHSRREDAVMRAGLRPGQPPRRGLTEDDCEGARTLFLRAEKASPPSRAPTSSPPMTALGSLGAGLLLLGIAGLVRHGRARR